MTLLLAALFTLIPVGDGVRTDEHVAAVEHNHVYQVDSRGERLQFVQVIFWDVDDTGKWRVTAWRWSQKHDGGRTAVHVDLRRRVLTYCDGDQMRRVRFDSFRTTSSNFDHEVERRKTTPQAMRKGLVEWKR